MVSTFKHLALDLLFAALILFSAAVIISTLQGCGTFHFTNPPLGPYKTPSDYACTEKDVPCELKSLPR